MTRTVPDESPEPRAEAAPPAKPPTPPRRVFRELLARPAVARADQGPCVDALTPELRQRIATASRSRLIGALLPPRR